MRTTEQIQTKLEIARDILFELRTKGTLNGQELLDDKDMAIAVALMRGVESGLTWALCDCGEGIFHPHHTVFPVEKDNVRDTPG